MPASVWTYRFSPMQEREQKRQYETSGNILRDGLAWTYTLLGGDKKQLATYNGVQGEFCGQNAVWMWPVEHNSYGPAQTRIITRPNGFKEFVIPDHLGSSRLTISAEGDVLQRSDYEPFGSSLANEGVGSRTSYIGREEDGESGLGFYGVRLYEPEYGRFTSVDPLWGKYPIWSPYTYTGNMPIGFFDFGGLSLESFTKLMSASRTHLSAIWNRTQNTGNEHAGWLIGDKKGDWVKWSGPLVEGSEAHVDKGVNHSQYNSRFPGQSTQPNSNWGETLVAGVHTHPNGGPPSGRDLSTFFGESVMQSNSIEQFTSTFNLIVTEKQVFGMEIVDLEKLKDFGGGGDVGEMISAVWNAAYGSTSGTAEERRKAANKAVVSATGGAIEFYVCDRETGKSTKD